MNWGEVYLDHYERHLGAPSRREIYERNPGEPSIQVLSFEGVFPGCQVFCTLGASNFAADLGSVAEICLVADNAFEECSAVLANSTFYLVANRMTIGRGIAVAGVETVSNRISREFDKDAVYITRPYVFPDGFEHVSSRIEGKSARIYWASLIARSEFVYFSKEGADAFEELLEREEVDLFSIDRASMSLRSPPSE